MSEQRAVAAAEALGLAAVTQRLGADTIDIATTSGVVIARPCHSAIRADCNRIVTGETPTHEYATIATGSGAD